ncbi:Calcineurin-like_phosphoesterase [Hexamita inflata]|uniref:Calcineurin-like phosphoesterase n=1 Tax=Hexamita inflata TaxID=28002 RepID=A0AA86NWL3_9EUKA|nr:Calcineurin-like phosphoesterase [Hexamita inflata]
MLRTTFISDLHGQYQRLKLPGGDLLLCCGDILSSSKSQKQTVQQISDFCQWLNNQSYSVKIFVAGNHDLIFEAEKDAVKTIVSQYSQIYYLLFEHVELNINGIPLKIFGGPYYQYYYSQVKQCFKLTEEKRIEILNKIDPDTDIIITHGPPKGFCDISNQGNSCGCQNLVGKIIEIKPRLCAFGHIHEAGGIQANDQTWFINASIMEVGFHTDYVNVQTTQITRNWVIEPNLLE